VNPLPLKRPCELEACRPEDRWLIESLWAEQAVGIVGGQPKCGKSYLALEVAVSVASGAPCLRRFPVVHAGPVLLFAAEDPPSLVRERLEGIARTAGVSFESLDIHVITAPVLRLDRPQDRQRLHATVQTVQPRLLVLDPFVRLHRKDENVAAEVAPLLAYLRGLQRRFQTAVLLVHHARKGAATVRAGQALRGSSELHAWGDSNLYLRRHGDQLRLAIEHRGAADPEELALELRTDNGGVALHVVETDPTESRETKRRTTAAERIEQALAEAKKPLDRTELRQTCRIRMSTLCRTLNVLDQQGVVSKEDGKYRLANPEGAVSGSHPSL
jgi:hypothetical protein